MPRIDIPDKVSGTYTFVHNVRVPGMVHGRLVRPRGQAAYGADPAIVSLDESSIKHIPDARVVRKGNFLGVVAPREYDAIQAAAQLKVSWADTPAVSGVGNLFANWRAQDSAGQAVASRAVHQATDYDFQVNPDKVDAALASAAQVVSATYKYHYNGHLPIGPSCCVADVTPNGAIIYSNTQQVSGTRTRLVRVLGLPANIIRVKYYEGSSVYGDSGYNEAAVAAAVMSQLAGKPVRLQYMRWDEHGWDFYGPPQMMDIRGGVDAKGNIAGIDYTAFTFGSTSSDLVTAQVTETPIAAPTAGSVEHWGVIGSMYNLPTQRVTVKNVPALNNQFRTSFLRAPLGPQANFAYEQMIDELAYAAKMDPYQFRVQNVATRDKPAAPLVLRRALARGAERSCSGCEVAAAGGGVEALGRDRGHRTRHLELAAFVDACGGDLGDRGEQEDRQDRGQEALHVDGRWSLDQPRVRREPDHRRRSPSSQQDVGRAGHLRQASR